MNIIKKNGKIYKTCINNIPKSKIKRLKKNKNKNKSFVISILKCLFKRICGMYSMNTEKCTIW